MRSRSLACFAAAALMSACAPVESQRGYVPDQVALQSVQVGMDTKDTVATKLGDPSTSATFGNDVWYYISSHVEQSAFFAPRATDRTVLAVEFGKDGKVSDMHRYGLADGHIVDFVGRETPTNGKQMTLLQQIFNAVPGNIGQTQQAPQGNPGDTPPGR